ncbi:MAG: hypothetical protein QF745_00660, partial [Planctomycetota bacterium]|nr:hypothetical protein [Planctomycetota bacterium]
MMEFSLWGAFILLVLVNPVVFVATYDWWLCFSGVCRHLSRRRCNLDVPHLRFPADISVDICALVSATLVYTLAFQNFRSSIA